MKKRNDKGKTKLMEMSIQMMKYKIGQLQRLSFCLCCFFVITK